MTERKKSYYCTVVARAGVELSPTPPFSCKGKLILPLPQITRLSGDGELDAAKPLPPSVERLSEIVQRATETLVSLGEQIASENPTFQVGDWIGDFCSVQASYIRTCTNGFYERSGRPVAGV